MPTVKVNEVNISYAVHGQGEPLFLIMGYSGGRRHWFPQVRAFRKHHQVVTIDNRGVGSSDKPSEPYTIRTMADDAIGVMDHLAIDSSHILGISMGGIVAQEIAINYPERVRRLILGSTFAGGEEVSELSAGMRSVLGLSETFTVEDAESVTSNVDVVKFMTTVAALSFNKRLYRMIVVPLSKIYARSIGHTGLRGQFEACADCNTLDRLHMIEALTLVITGTEDKVVPTRSSDMIASRIPNAKLVKFHGGSHSLHLEWSRRFNKEVLDFLRGD